jgi:glycosyltransferase involved in cell wall biosynthesis
VINADKLYVIKKGVDINWFHPINEFEYAFKSINPNCKIITCVAHLRPVKGVDYLIQAAQILEEFEDLHFVFIGKGTDTKQFQQKISKLSNSSRLHGIGDVVDIRPHIKACDVYVQPSISEGLAKTLIEAMAYSKPIIATRSGGPQEIIKDEVSGKIVSVKDPKAIAKGIIELNSDYKNAEKLGAAANAFLLRELTIESTIKKTLELYKKITQ